MGKRDDVCKTSSQIDSLLEKLFSHRRGDKTGLFPMQKIDELQGHLHQNFRSIHVAGTNGKGSVCHKISKALQIAGYKVGLYTSPHLFSFRERIQINGECISEEAILRLLPPIMDLTAASFFDYTTALAFAYFAETSVDYAVIETGIGGRHDSTNVISPVLSIITSIDYDHTHLLGSTLEEITYEKAGIIKPNIPYVLGNKVPLLEGLRAPPSATPFYDEDNCLTAKLGLEILKIPPSAIEAGIKALPPCRFELFYDRFLLDVAHNPDAITKLIKALRHHFPQKKFHFIVGFSADKDAASCLRLLAQVGHISCVSNPNPRLLRAEELGALARSLGIEVSIKKEMSLDKTEEDGLTVICGSFYLMAPAKRAIEEWAKRCK